MVPLLPALYDEPFSDSSQIPTFILSRFAGQSVTVSLSGDGGDELLGGYRIYEHCQAIWGLSSHIPSSWRKRVSSCCSRLARPGMHMPGQRGRRFGRAAARLEILSRRAVTADCIEDVRRAVVSHCREPGDVVLGSAESPDNAT